MHGSQEILVSQLLCLLDGDACEESNGRKLSFLQAASQRPAFLPLVRSHVRGVRYGISRQVQHYLERLSDLSGKSISTSPNKNQLLTPEGLFKWTQTYCEAWMRRFSVRRDNTITDWPAGLFIEPGPRNKAHLKSTRCRPCFSPWVQSAVITRAPSKYGPLRRGGGLAAWILEK